METTTNISQLRIEIRMKQFAQQVVNSKWFSPLIIGLIIFNAIVIGLETSPQLTETWGWLFTLINDVILVVFIIEAVLKMAALSPHVFHYFKDGWNIFDFSVIMLALIPASSGFGTLARVARLFRVLRLFSALRQLRLIVTTLARSVPGILNIVILMSIIFYVYGVLGYQLFHTIDPEHWSTLGISLLTLFRIVTLEDWTDIMYTAMDSLPFAWIYFVSFVVVGTFVIINMFIAVVMNSLAEAQKEHERSSQATKQDILSELKKQREVIAQLEKKLGTVNNKS